MLVVEATNRIGEIKVEAWEKAVDCFLDDWKRRDEFIGALVCGSYITGDPSNRSDIDVHIILADDVEWRERGNRYVNGFLIEYFANPPAQIRRYFADDFSVHQTSSMVQFITGKVIYDDYGIIKDLREEAVAWKAREYATQKPSIVEMRKYHLWDTLDNLLDCYENQRSDFDFVYYLSLHSLFRSYCKLLNVEQIPFDHLGRYLSEPAYLRKYLKEPFPDPHFARLFLAALVCKEHDEQIRLYEALSNHVIGRCGGFEIDGWILKTPLDI